MKRGPDFSGMPLFHKFSQLLFYYPPKAGGQYTMHTGCSTECISLPVVRYSLCHPPSNSLTLW